MMTVIGGVTAGEVVMIIVVLHSDVSSGVECVYSAPCWLERTRQTDPTLFLHVCAQQHLMVFLHETRIKDD